MSRSRFGSLLSPTQRAIARALADENDWAKRASFLSGIDEATLWEEAVQNDLESQIAHVLIEGGPTSEINERWLKAHEETRSRISSYLDELEALGRRFEAAGISLIALKNSGIALRIVDCPGCCPMGDIDVLISRDDLVKGHTLLLDEGYEFKSRSPMEVEDVAEASRRGGTEYRKQIKGGRVLWLELQWRPVAGRWIQETQEPRTDELIVRSSATSGSSVRLLHPVDNLLQVCLHTAKHSYSRAPGFRLHTDVDRICRHEKIDWSSFVDDVARLRVRTACYFSLAIPRELMDTPIPDAVLALLEPRKWRRVLLERWISRAGLFGAEEKKFGRWGYIIFTSLLFDDLRSLWRGVFPSASWMSERFGRRGSVGLLGHYVRRMVDLLFRRV